jgi:lipopolysaccharide export system permease protein
MNLLSRYIFQEFIRTAMTILIGIVVLYLSITFLKEADIFIQHKASLSQIGRYYFYSIPGLAGQALPFAALIGTLLSLGALSRYNEITAMRAGGISILRIISPVLLGGLLLSAVGFLNNEVIMPAYAARASRIRNIEVEKRQEIITFQQRRLWLRGPDNSIVNIDLVTPDRRELLGVNIFKLNPDFSVRERIRAEKLVWENDAWRLHDSEKFVISGTSARAGTADGDVYNIVERPEDMNMIAKNSTEMNFSELWDYVRRLKSSGYKAVRYEVDLHTKLSYPFACLLMVMIATPLSIQRARSGGAARGIALAVVIAAVYWALMSFGRALGTAGTLPPLEAAWFGNIIVAIAAIIAMGRMQKRM